MSFFTNACGQLSVLFANDFLKSMLHLSYLLSSLLIKMYLSKAVVSGSNSEPTFQLSWITVYDGIGQQRCRPDHKRRIALNSRARLIDNYLSYRGSCFTRHYEYTGWTGMGKEKSSIIPSIPNAQYSTITRSTRFIVRCLIFQCLHQIDSLIFWIPTTETWGTYFACSLLYIFSLPTSVSVFSLSKGERERRRYVRGVCSAQHIAQSTAYQSHIQAVPCHPT